MDSSGASGGARTFHSGMQTLLAGPTVQVGVTAWFANTFRCSTDSAP